MRTPKITVALAALAMLAACEDLRPVQWMAPPGVTGRQINQDVATCKAASGVGPALVGAEVSPDFMSAAVLDQATDNYVACMRNAGYTDTRQ
jgi:hypothetical protein